MESNDGIPDNTADCSSPAPIFLEEKLDDPLTKLVAMVKKDFIEQVTRKWPKWIEQFQPK
jgi:hypothetical protein